MIAKPYVYKLTHKDSGQFYIGYREKNRMPANLDIGHYYFSSSNIIKELGFENFLIEIIDEFDDGDEAYKFENYLIESLFHDPLILNKHFRKNGKAKFKFKSHTEESKIKIGDMHRGKIISEETKIKMKSIIKDSDWRDKIKLSKLGKSLSEEHKHRISESHIGLKHNEDTKIKISKSLIGKIHSEEHINNMVKSKSKKFILISPSGEVYNGSNLRKFCRDNNLTQSNMAALCRGEKQSHKGWSGKYVD